MFIKLRDQLVIAIILIVMKLSSFIPYSLIPKFSTSLANILCKYLPRERDIAISQIKVTIKYPDPLELYKQSLASLIMLIVEGARIKTLVPVGVKKEGGISKNAGVVSFDNKEEVQPILDSGNGAVCLVSHTGNFELMAAYFISQGVPLTVIAREPNYGALIDIIKKFRNGYGLDFIWREELGNPKKLLQALRGGKFLSALIDQDTPLESIYVPFFGLDAAYPRGPLSLAIRQKKPVFMAFSARLDDGSHKVFAERINWEDKFSKDQMSNTLDAEIYLAEEYSKGLERHIRKYPAQWVWWHRRWRRRPGEEKPKSTTEYINWLNSLTV